MFWTKPFPCEDLTLNIDDVKNEEDTGSLTLLLYIVYRLYLIYIYGLLQNCKVAVHWTVGPVFKDGCDGSKMCPHHFQILLYGKCRG